MEPVIELATRIATLLWRIHSTQSGPSSLRAAIDSGWRAKIETSASRDNASFQALLDLADIEVDWTQSDPLSQFKLDGETTPGKWLNIVPNVPALRRNARERQARHSEVRQMAIREALETLHTRIEVLDGGGLVRYIDENTGPLAVGDSRWITRDQLFDRIAEWAFGPAALLPIHGDDSTPADSPPKNALIQIAIGFMGQGEARKSFFMEAALDRYAQSAQGREQHGIAQEWLSNTRDGKLDVLLDRQKLRARCVRLGAPVPFTMVQSDELDEIARSRLIRLHGETPGPPGNNLRARSGISSRPGTPARQAFDSALFGVALSGGGIRSATFALGLLQGMADRNILPWIDILSTVSGGGYIGSWLVAWTKRRGSIASVQESLRGFASGLALEGPCTPAAPDVTADPLHFVQSNSDPHSDHVRPVRILRDYARFLAPRSGFFSPDNWTIATIWLRNTLLNLAILLPVIAAVLLAPRVFVLAWAIAGASIRNNPYMAVLLANLFFLVASWRIAWRNLSTFGSYTRPTGQTGRGEGDQQIARKTLPLIVGGAFAEVAVIWNLKDSPHTRSLVGLNAGLFAVAFCILFLVTRYRGQQPLSAQTGSTRRTFGALIAVLASVLISWALLDGLYLLPRRLPPHPDYAIWQIAAAGVAVVVLAIAAIFVFFIGLYGRDLTDEQREWWSRLASWLGIATLGWTLLASIAFFAPLLLLKLLGPAKAKIAAGGGWAAVVWAGAKWAFNPRSGRNGNAAGQPWLKNLVMRIAPLLFVLGLAAIVSMAALALVAAVSFRLPVWTADPNLRELRCSSIGDCYFDLLDCYWRAMSPASSAPIALLFLLTVLALVLASRIDVNEFSMHNFYKNRLVRAYLGASRTRAHYPNNFTGFDLEDDLPLARFQSSDVSRRADAATDALESYAGPFPVLNTAINITKGADLGVQQRKAESFVFTPLWSGFDFSRRQAAVAETNLSEYAFQRTDRFGHPDRDGAMLGTVVAISGAAFNANAGFHTSPSLAFLLTVFGVRLGWWAGNPRKNKWNKPSPGTGLLYLTNELTANTSTARDFVLLSDGGHFENMGLYELVRRRCRFVIVADAEEDEKFKLEGIGGAIRKCRVDFGVSIELSLDALQPLGNPAVSRFHYSLGTITYPGEEIQGKLLYIKAAVTGNEPVDVVEFRKRHGEFPHTSTADQFFDESHFESYRALGHHTAREVFTSDLPSLPLPSADDPSVYLDRMFSRMESDWAARLAWLTRQQNAGAMTDDKTAAN